MARSAYRRASSDNMKDLELVNVEDDRDSDPHIEGANEGPIYNYKSIIFTAFNHFIDIGKGISIFRHQRMHLVIYCLMAASYAYSCQEWRTILMRQVRFKRNRGYLAPKVKG